VSEAIAFCFPEDAKGTELENASLVIHEIDGMARCESCGAEFQSPSILTNCSSGSFRFVRFKGDELKVKSIEVDDF
jgi:hydrogenase nickel incorporation protein HypA/HybF